MIQFKFKGPNSTLIVGASEPIGISPPRLFDQFSSNAQPIATPSRRQSSENIKTIRQKIQSLLQEDVIEDSRSPWISQTLPCHRLFTNGKSVHELDAFPLPRIDDLVNKIAQNQLFLKIDLQSAYHQIPLHADDRKFTSFEADGRLY